MLEILMHNGSGLIYTDNLRSAQATDIYTLSGNGVEVYEPRFTYHGKFVLASSCFPALSFSLLSVTLDSLSPSLSFACLPSFLYLTAKSLLQDSASCR